MEIVYSGDVWRRAIPKVLSPCVEAVYGARFDRRTRKHLEAIHAFSLRLSVTTSDADDLVQETYLRAYRYWHKYTPGTRCRSWLFTLCRNVFVRRWRRRARDRELLEKNAGPEARHPAPGSGSCFGSPPADPGRSSLGRIVGEEILRALAGLPEPYRDAVPRYSCERAYSTSPRTSAATSRPTAPLE